MLYPLQCARAVGTLDWFGWRMWIVTILCMFQQNLILNPAKTAERKRGHLALPQIVAWGAAPFPSLYYSSSATPLCSLHVILNTCRAGALRYLRKRSPEYAPLQPAEERCLHASTAQGRAQSESPVSWPQKKLFLGNHPRREQNLIKTPGVW